ncbi:MAG: MarR family winged helix-turn-helix transcriptional regulator [Oscillospiraceae bacterium]
MMEEGVCAMLIKQIHSELEKNANNMLRKDDLTLSQVGLLLELEKSENCQLELKELEEVLHIAKPTAVGIVQRLEDKGFVESTRSEQDKRIRLIRLTQQGKECCCKARDNMQKTEAVLTSSLTEKEQDILVTLLKKVRNSF